MVFHPGPALILFDLLRVVLGGIFVVGLFYLLIKLARLVDAMIDAKRASSARWAPDTTPIWGGIES